MDENRSNTTFFIIGSIIYTVLVAILSSFSSSGRIVPAAGLNTVTFVGIACLCFIFISLLFPMLSRYEKTIALLKEKKQSLEKECETLNQNKEKIIEQRTFEIAVINASLNREIAERIQAETAALELKKQMELILNAAGEGIFGIDLDGNLMFVNTSALIMIGWERDDMIGKPHHELVHHHHADGSPYHAEDCPIRKAYLDGIVHSCSEDIFWTKEGTSFPVEYVSTPIIDKEVICGAVVVFRDKSTFA